ncbi:unnamed protein product (macronuclear) [Paramecium tetraurelia]|uniref:Uncharacterized protein n=1 Tax=Paramecium tetraurelia TaxID=5888 RepID=A0D9X4_PARTE|nr:uncharacterized protein GSPATT00014773001 [Paramecium tetraurelia]CAK79841.1 unnamed protein product [Paramecium tetraurelia]|eukprot:XP_001447238.1 hypothetical protein (macronuclear) [Paramecium tetraurelia strain d4-2]
MVYGRLIYNNVKDYTPQWFKTIPYQQTVKPTFVRKPQVVSRLNSDPKVKALWRFLGRNVADNPWAWQVYIFANSFVIFGLCYYPWLWVYQFNNKKRTIDYALQQEKEWKAKQAAAEE